MSSLKEKWYKLKNKGKNKWGNIDNGGLGVEKWIEVWKVGMGNVVEGMMGNGKGWYKMQVGAIEWCKSGGKCWKMGERVGVGNWCVRVWGVGVLHLKIKRKEMENLETTPILEGIYS